jgi:hypothetical protein
MKDPEKKVFLKITTWAGFLGVHYYGSLWCDGKKIDIRWVPGDKYRRMLNYFEDKELWGQIKKGDDTSKFLREYDLIKEAKKQWKKLFPAAEILIKGDPMSIHDEIDESFVLDKIKNGRNEK